MTCFSKTVLVTGCTSGIGRATSLYLSQKGYGLVLVGRDKDKLKELSSVVNAKHICLCDLADSEQIYNTYNELKNNNIRINGVLHCAGINIPAPINLLKENDLLNLLNINFYSFVFLCKYVAKRSVLCDNSSIVALSSLATVTRFKGSLSYVASKTALEGAVSVAAKELAKRRIRVNAILPAMVKTRMTQNIDDIFDMENMQPFGIIEPLQIAYLIEFLLSDKSKFITGAFIPVSAGMSGR